MSARLVGWLFVVTAFATLSLSQSANPQTSGQGKNRVPDISERKSVTLQVDKIPFSKALAELTKQTGIRVEDARGVPDEAIHVDWKQTTFWQALDALAAAGKARVQLYSTSGRIVLAKRGADYRLPPTSYDGRFRLRVKKVTTSRDLEISDQNGRSGATNLVVEIAWDPELLPLYLETRPHALRLVDESNNVRNLPDEGSSLAPVDGRIALDIDLHLPALPRRMTAIRSVEGKLSMIGPSKMLSFTFETLKRLAQTKANDPERHLTQEGVACRILDVKLLRDHWTVKIALDYPPGLKQLDTNQSWVVNNEMTLESPDGKKHLPSNNYVLHSASARGAVLSYHFRDRGDLARGKASDWRLRYRTPANLVETPIKFAFKDIPLPVRRGNGILKLMTTFQPADNLRSRTFLGLLVAQFLAAFNDQAIHASSMFFAINTNAMSKDTAISLMPILFYAPWALFCTLAGYLADRFSKWNSLVFWKVAEIGITAIALLGFWLGTHGVTFGPYLVLSTVFLMGTHSAFFVPAKYGAMPEILQPHMLSRGNGVLESLSFLAVILGTVLGGVLSQVFRGQEYYIGVILVALALIGALASLLMRRMPAANPNRPFPPYLYQPLWQSIRTLLRSRPLALAVVGIAFFTFIVAFMRSTMYMHGQTRVPPWDEALTSEVVGMVALGIGLGSPLVGFLSGGKVELGMVPIGALGMIAATLIAACALDRLPALVVCITLIGFFTGFYIVPLFTLLQHRAPKTSKGDAIATSNFINVTGAIIASVLFFLSVGAAHLTGITPRVSPGGEIEGQLVEDPKYEDGKPVRIVLRTVNGWPRYITAKTRNGRSREIDVETELIDVFGGGLKAGDRVIDRSYRLGSVTYHRIRRFDQVPRPFYDESGLPRLLFIGSASMTLLTLVLLWRQMPDLFLRTLIWLRTQQRYRLEIDGLNQLPDKGPVVVATNARGMEACLHVVSATDRATRFLFVDAEQSDPLPLWLRLPALWFSLGRWLPGTNGSDERLLRRKIEQVLSHGGVVALTRDGGWMTEHLLGELEAPLLPVWYEPAPLPERKRRQRIYILAGRLLPTGSSMEEVEREWQRLADEVKQRAARGGPLRQLEFVGH